MPNVAFISVYAVVVSSLETSMWKTQQRKISRLPMPERQMKTSRAGDLTVGADSVFQYHSPPTEENMVAGTATLCPANGPGIAVVARPVLPTSGSVVLPPITPRRRGGLGSQLQRDFTFPIRNQHVKNDLRSHSANTQSVWSLSHARVRTA